MRKAAVSVRIGASDVRDVKAIARRLGVRDSDVFRYAVKNSLAQLAPLVDPKVQGRDLLPVFIEAGPGLLRYFELDAAKLGEIVNTGVDKPELRVAAEDLTLLSMAGIKESYALVKLGELLDDKEPLPAEKDGLVEILREYLYGKYAFRAVRRLAAG
jgi:hypothetical protein